MLKTKNFSIKNDDNIDLCLLTKDKQSKEFFIVALKNNKQVGFCHFIFENDECKISRIAITNKNYLSKGVGSIMFNVMEKFAYDNKMNTISGLFIPRGYENAWQMTSNFYKKHNMKSLYYDFDYVERDEIYKTASNHDEACCIPININKSVYDDVEKYNYEIYDMFSSSHNKNKAQTPAIEL